MLVGVDHATRKPDRRPGVEQARAAAMQSAEAENAGTGGETPYEPLDGPLATLLRRQLDRFDYDGFRTCLGVGGGHDEH